MEGSRASGMGSVDVASSSKTSCKSNSRLKVRYKWLTVLDQVGSNLSKMDRNGSKWIKLNKIAFLTCVESKGDSCKCGLFPKHDNQDCVESIASKLDARIVDSVNERVKLK